MTTTECRTFADGEVGLPARAREARACVCREELGLVPPAMNSPIRAGGAPGALPGALGARPGLQGHSLGFGMRPEFLQPALGSRGVPWVLGVNWVLGIHPAFLECPLGSGGTSWVPEAQAWVSGMRPGFQGRRVPPWEVRRGRCKRHLTLPRLTILSNKAFDLVSEGLRGAHGAGSHLLSVIPKAAQGLWRPG